MKFIKKAKRLIERAVNLPFDLFLAFSLKLLLWMNKWRPLWLFIAFLFGLFLAILFIWLVYKIDPPKNECFWGGVLSILKNYPTIILVVPSLPVAAVLWVFRNHDIVMNLDLQMYHEATRNIHSENASEGLRQVAFGVLMLLRRKWTWRYKINHTFVKANLSKLIITSNDSIDDILLIGANLTEAIVMESVNFKNASLCEANLTRINFHDRSSLRGAELVGANLTEANLENIDLTGTHVIGAYYYKDEEAEKKDERTPVTRKWLREDRKAENVDAVRGIPLDSDIDEDIPIDLGI